MSFLVAINGSKKEWEQLVKEWAPRLFKYITSNFRQNIPLYEVEDIIQETFIRVSLSAEKTYKKDEKANFNAWIITIAKNLSLDYLRKKGKKLTENVGPEQETIQLLNPDGQLEKQEIVEAVKYCMDKMTYKLKEAAEFNFFAEYQLKEIAEKLEITLGAVKMRIWEARKQLIQCLERRLSQKTIALILGVKDGLH